MALNFHGGSWGFDFNYSSAKFHDFLVELWKGFVLVE